MNIEDKIEILICRNFEEYLATNPPDVIYSHFYKLIKRIRELNIEADMLNKDRKRLNKQLSSKKAYILKSIKTSRLKNPLPPPPSRHPK